MTRFVGGFTVRDEHGRELHRFERSADDPTSRQSASLEYDIESAANQMREQGKRVELHRLAPARPNSW